jgi:hypothetical protein
MPHEPLWNIKQGKSSGLRPKQHRKAAAQPLTSQPPKDEDEKM